MTRSSSKGLTPCASKLSFMMGLLLLDTKLYGSYVAVLVCVCTSLL